MVSQGAIPFETRPALHHRMDQISDETLHAGNMPMVGVWYAEDISYIGLLPNLGLPDFITAV